MKTRHSLPPNIAVSTDSIQGSVHLLYHEGQTRDRDHQSLRGDTLHSRIHFKRGANLHGNEKTQYIDPLGR
jgi:hypothetical protein